MDEQGIYIEGWGGYADLHEYRLRADYQPGFFELGQLLASALGAGTAIGAAVLGIGLNSGGWTALAWVCLAGSLGAIVGAGGAWAMAFSALIHRGERSVDLLMGSVEVGSRTRPLRGAQIEIETTGLGRILTLARLSLVFPDGARVPFAQGRLDEIDEVAQQLRRAPSLTVPRSLAA